MTAAVDLGQRHSSGKNRADQLEQLRRQMAAVSGKVGVGRRGAGPSAAPADPVFEAVLPVPSLLAGVLPAGLPRGTVAVLSGARSLMLSMVATVTAAGGNAAIVGQPDLGLLAASEMGADLSRLAVIPDPGNDPVEVATVLMDGMDLVVLGLGGRSVPPARTRVVLARARHRGCALLVSGGAWQGTALQLDARVSGYETVGDKMAGCGAIPGFGRIGAVRLEVRAAGRAAGRTRAG
ncbi:MULTISPECIES: hypothetical protein [Mycolicibacter]|uniref:Uncharacterized protein n=1 Tax=Mycolicibacter virginiensis TaxID=1795032 RepID=A0A9X7NZ11_9MYCO|nr:MULTISPECIES: hypothetical protein [Mycolicibacter]OBJ30877.1 hypothetical protein A5631_01740 [Mycolicibacter heraklionensis]PQM52629.1 hypothetical protein C5U48_08685 [Mycolicibacter virginiensis]ULP46728.1 hypothetical protein MJO54_18275 [Mycolicibacter virginiensis]